MKIVLASLLAVSALSAPVAAADLYVPEQAPVYQPAAAPEVTVAAASGWYLRGDVGYSFNELRGVKFFQGSNDTYSSFDKHDLHDNFTAGVGVGYQVNDMFRSDLTFDYMFKSKFRGSTHSSGGATAGTACENACSSTDISSLTAYSLMANAYVDLGTYYSVTPYVGGGIGGTYVKWGDLKNTACDDDSAGNGCDDTVTHKGRGGWRFSYALMAGAAIDVTCNLKADIGYRYRHVSGGNMFGFASNGGPGYHKAIDQHEVRAGLRYTFNSCNNEVAYVPPVEIPTQPPVYK